MSENNPVNQAHGGRNPDGVFQNRRPYWRRAHEDWRFWVMAILIFACLLVYVLTVEFTLPPRGQPVPMLVEPKGK